MTNKGILYERAWRNELRTRTGVVWAERFAASHGPFDVACQTNEIVGGWMELWQCKKEKMTCWVANNLMLATWDRLGMPTTFSMYVVHRTKDKEFCEH